MNNEAIENAISRDELAQQWFQNRIETNMEGSVSKRLSLFIEVFEIF